MRKLVFCLIVVVVAVLNCVNSAPLSISRKNIGKAAKFLFQFGYINRSKTNSAGANDPNSPVFRTAIRKLQRFGNIRVTGKLDEKTIELISTSRCGMNDPILPTSRDVGEFNLHPSFWKKKDLTYRIVNFTDDGIQHEKQREIFHDAFHKWQEASGQSGLRIREVYSTDADILISFVTKDHGDGYSFDGQGGNLAHAFYPADNTGRAGDAHFDDDERFTTGTNDGINLDWVAVHEFGHSLGLDHSNVRESIMYPWYQGYRANIQLSNDDIQGIHTRYGTPQLTTKQPPTTTKTPTTTEQPTTIEAPTSTEAPTTPEHPACLPGTRYDTVFAVDRLTYFFKGDLFWTVNWKMFSGLTKSEPKRVTDFWPEVETPVDAAYRNKKNSIVFFKGSKFWEYFNNTIQGHGVRESEVNRRPYRLLSLKNMNAVLSYEGKPKVHFFKGTTYWLYNDKNRRFAKRSPRNISPYWPKDVVNLDAAVMWPINKRVYIFKGQDYYKLNRNRKIVKGYPKPIATRWMRCVKPGMMSMGSLSSALTP